METKTKPEQEEVTKLLARLDYRDKISLMAAFILGTYVDKDGNSLTMKQAAQAALDLDIQVGDLLRERRNQKNRSKAIVPSYIQEKEEEWQAP